MTDHKNDERTVRCPVDGCDAMPLARGINLHIMQSSGGGHGPQGEVPDDISLDNLETVGEQEVEMDYPEERDSEQVARLCPYCSTPYTGTNGVLIHLGQVAGRKNHPEDAAEKHSEEDFPRVEVDDAGNVTRTVGNLAGSGYTDVEQDAVSKQRVYHLLADLVADNEIQVAHRVRLQLLGIDNANRPLRTEPVHPDLFEALLTQYHADETEHRVTAAVEKEGIMVACRGESGLYTAEEARDTAAALEQVLNGGEVEDDELADLIEFLRHGADVLDRDTTRRLHEEFDHWR